MTDSVESRSQRQRIPRATALGKNRHTGHGDEGVTLLELMMVMAISSVVGALVLGTIFTMGNLVTKTTEKTDDFIQARHALDEISVNLRGATGQGFSPGLLTDTKPNRIQFNTRSGGGLETDPVTMAYEIKNGDLRQVIPGNNNNFGNPKTVRTLVRGVKNSAVFEFYTWEDPKKPGGKCFRKIDERHLSKITRDPATGRELVGIHAKNAIAGVKIALQVRDDKNARFKDNQGHSTWVRLGESIEPKDPETGALIPGWPQNCWKVFDES